ncbi:accessory factor UbiK family protein [Biformimicrobium ophioploci]|nr:accessory factor UbiK family protein [Microbulbifer sp. NKW57]
MADERWQTFLNDLQQQGAVIGSDLRAALKIALGKLPVVSQEEFDTQAALLARTRERLQQLEDQVAELERQLDADH